LASEWIPGAFFDIILSKLKAPTITIKNVYTDVKNNYKLFLRVIF